MALPAENINPDNNDKVIRLIHEIPSETESGKKFIDNTTRIIAKEYGVGNRGRLNEVVRTRITVATDELKRKFKRNNEGNIEPSKENMDKVGSAVRADLYHLLITE